MLIRGRYDGPSGEAAFERLLDTAKRGERLPCAGRHLKDAPAAALHSRYHGVLLIVEELNWQGRDGSEQKVGGETCGRYGNLHLRPAPDSGILLF